MASRYRCKADDVLDWICWQHYGRDRGAVELVLEANPHLADLGPQLPGGTIVELPDLPTPAVATDVVRLWD